MIKVRNIFLNAGKDFVIDTLTETGTLIDEINTRLAYGEIPGNQSLWFFIIILIFLTYHCNNQLVNLIIKIINNYHC